MNKWKCKLLMVLTFLLATLPLPLASIALVGCTGGCASIGEGQDPVVVNAERVAAASFEIMDTFNQMEFNNRDELRKLSPEIEKAANHVRVEGKAALESLRAATKAYKTNRTPENKANVATWIATVESFRDIAKQFLVAPKTASAVLPSAPPATSAPPARATPVPVK